MAIALGACTGAGDPVCQSGPGTPSVAFTLFFGESIPGGGEITEQNWQAFLNDVVTPIVPNGYTVLNAEGAWMNPRTHQTTREKTKVLLVVLPESAGSVAAINQIRAAYQVRFHQQLVGMETTPTCAVF
jgi:hypothetical protein